MASVHSQSICYIHESAFRDDQQSIAGESYQRSQRLVPNRRRALWQSTPWAEGIGMSIADPASGALENGSPTYEVQ